MKWVWIGLIVLGLAFLGATKLFGRPPEELRQMGQQRDAIGACRAAQDDALQELATRRLTRQVCDKMESDYRAKWGVNP